MSYTELREAYKCIRGNLVAINSREFLAFAGFRRLPPHTLQLVKFSADSDQWTPLPFTLDADYDGHPTLVYDKRNNNVFIGGVSNRKLCSVNLSTGETTRYPIRNLSQSMLLVRGHLHIFGDSEYGAYEFKHAVLDTANATITNRDVSFDLYGVQHTSYSESRNSIIMLVEDRDRSNTDRNTAVYEYSLKNHEFHCLMHHDVFALKCRWTGVVSTLNGRYILGFGGVAGNMSHRPPDCIAVYDLWTHTFAESTIKCPMNHAFRAVLLEKNGREELATSGFIRREFERPEMSEVPIVPLHVIQLMSRWYSMEEVHLITRYGKRHWKIDLHEIVQSTLSQK